MHGVLTNFISDIMVWSGNLPCSWSSSNKNSLGQSCLAAMCVNMTTSAHGHWTGDHLEVVVGKYKGKILGCPYSTHLIQDWRQWCLKFNSREDDHHRATLFKRKDWSAVFEQPLALQEPIKAYNLMKLGIRYIDDIVDHEAQVLSFPAACCKYLGKQRRPVWRKISILLWPFCQY